jgi:hypothetical protein
MTSTTKTLRKSFPYSSKTGQNIDEQNVADIGTNPGSGHRTENS